MNRELALLALFSVAILCLFFLVIRLPTRIKIALKRCPTLTCSGKIETLSEGLKRISTYFSAKIRTIRVYPRAVGLAIQRPDDSHHCHKMRQRPQKNKDMPDLMIAKLSR